MAIWETGKIQIYCGQGKGKTSALNGMVIRALGYKLNVVYLRFLKNRPSGEITSLTKFKQVQIYNFYHTSRKFFWELNAIEKTTLAIQCQQGLYLLSQILQSKNIDLIAIDEILGAIKDKLINTNDLVQLLKNRNPHIEVIITGRECPPALLDIADLVTEMVSLKHYFDVGETARKGIEY